MKKIILAVIAALTITSAAQAEMYQSIDIGASKQTYNTETANGYNIGYSGSKVWNNGMLFGVAFEYSAADLKEDKLSSFVTDIKAGYKYKDIAIYAIGSAIYQDLQNTAVGFGAGIGIEYFAFKHVGVGINYKRYSMTAESFDYDYDTAQTYLKILF